METKKCCVCNINKPVSEFYTRRNRPGWYIPSCKVCNSAKSNKYDKSQPPERKSWQSLKNRCRNPKYPQYKNYGGRGIKVCERWTDRKDGFKNFLADMGPRPTPKHEIDRIDNDGNYEPSNCHWVTRKENNRNKRSNVLTSEKVRIARWYYGFAGMDNIEIARILGINNRSTMLKAITGRTWAEVGNNK